MKASIFALLGLLVVSGDVRPADDKKDTVARRPHLVPLTFHLTGVDCTKDADAITASLKKVKSVTKAEVNIKDSYVQVVFDSHVVSFHQVAQAILDAGTETKKKFDPRLKIHVIEYAEGNNAAKVDAIFAGKRLLQRVSIEVVDKTTGQFIVHFLPLKLDPAMTGPQGFNGGHLNHPIHDPVPRGLGLTLVYTVVNEPPPQPAK